MKEALKAWLSYSRAERNGIIVLGLVIMLIAGYRLLLPVFEKPRAVVVDPSAFQQDIAVFKKDTLLDLNTATVEQLSRLKGIGPALSQRIIEYRNELGGYADIQQVNEVKGIGAAKYAALSPFLRADTGCMRKIALNTATEEQLEAHPYIDKELARAIANKRPFKTLAELKALKLMSGDRFARLEPYLQL